MDGLQMAALMMGWSLDDLRDQPMMMGVINTNSPRQLDDPMSQGLIALAEHGQVAIVTPFTLAGAMAPVSLAGALGPATCRGDVRHHPDPDRPARRAGDVWRLHLERRHEDRGARLRNPGICQGRAGQRSTRPQDRGAVPVLEHHGGQCDRRAGGLRIDDVALGLPDGRGASGDPRRGLDAWRADGQF
jgi:hypothetical protein